MIKQVLVASLLENIVMRCYVMLFLCMRVICYWVGHKNMTGRLMHDKFNNRYSYVKDSKYVILASLTPKQVHEDKIKLKKRVFLKKDSELADMIQERVEQENSDSSVIVSNVQFMLSSITLNPIAR